MAGSLEPNTGNIGRAWVFASDDIPQLTLPYRDGVVVYRPKPPRPGAGRTGTAGHKPGMVTFVPAEPHEAPQVAVHLARQPDPGSVVLHPRFSPAARTALAIGFAAHLADARRADGLDPNIVTTACTPDLRQLPGYVRVPHLLTISALTQENCERTIWEIMSIDACQAWLGGTDPDLRDVVEANLPGLLALRRLLRRPGSCEHLPNGRRIRQVLADADDNLTICRVYRDPEMFLPAAYAAAYIREQRLTSPPG